MFDKTISLPTLHTYITKLDPVISHDIGEEEEEEEEGDRFAIDSAETYAFHTHAYRKEKDTIKYVYLATLSSFKFIFSTLHRSNQ